MSEAKTINISLEEILKNEKPCTIDMVQIEKLSKLINKLLKSSKYHYPTNFTKKLNCKITTSITENFDFDIFYWKEQICCIVVYEKFSSLDVHSIITFTNSGLSDFMGKLIELTIEDQKELYVTVDYSENVKFEIKKILYSTNSWYFDE